MKYRSPPDCESPAPEGGSPARLKRIGSPEEEAGVGVAGGARGSSVGTGRSSVAAGSAGAIAAPVVVSWKLAAAMLSALRVSSVNGISYRTVSRETS
jgi:hypothetical protein